MQRCWTRVFFYIFYVFKSLRLLNYQLWSLCGNVCTKICSEKLQPMSFVDLFEFILCDVMIRAAEMSSLKSVGFSMFFCFLISYGDLRKCGLIRLPFLLKAHLIYWMSVSLYADQRFNLVVMIGMIRCITNELFSDVEEFIARKSKEFETCGRLSN